MIFRRIKIENFGILHNFELHLKPGLNYFSQSNEGGKSTLLEFVRRLFWGYPDRRSKLNPYPQLHDSGRYGGEAEVELDDGRCLLLARYGQKGELQCVDISSGVEVPLTADELTGVREKFYRSVYAVTLDELRELDDIESLGMRQDLYGSGLGVPAKYLPELDRQLKESADHIFRRRGSCQLNELLSAAGKLHEQIALAGAAGAECRSLLAKQDELAARKNTLLAENKAAEQEIVSLQNALKRSELQQELNHVAGALAKLDPLPAAGNIARGGELLRELLEVEKKCGSSAAELPVLAGDIAQARAQLSAEVDLDLAQPVAAGELAELTDVAAAAAAELPGYHRRRRIAILSVTIAAAAGAAVAVAAIFTGVWMILSALLLPLAVGCAGVRQLLRPQPVSVGQAAVLQENIGKKLAVRRDFSVDKLSEINYRLHQLERMNKAQLRMQTALQQQERKIAECARLFDISGSGYDDFAPVLNKWQEQSREADRLRKQELKWQQELATIPAAESGLSDISGLPEAIESARRRRQESADALLEIAAHSGGVDSELAAKLRQADVAAAETELDALQNDIRLAVTEYLRNVGARSILTLAVKKFEEANQPEVLRIAGKLFAAITGNRYPSLRRSLSRECLLFADSVSGREKCFSELSRGTREQLLLVMRLAMIELRERDAEKLPLILDDVSVNFDMTRAGNFKQALSSFATGRQVIVLSCGETSIPVE